MTSAGPLPAAEITWTRRAARIPPARLESCIRRLEPADRALLDLSLNRRLPDDQLAPLLHTEPIRLAWRRARAIERVASRLGLTHPADFAEVRQALTRLPDHAWLPLELQPAPTPLALKPPEPEGVEIKVSRPAPPPQARPPQAPHRRARSLPVGEITSSAKRLMPRTGMNARAKRALGPALIGLAAGVLLRKR